MPGHYWFRTRGGEPALRALLVLGLAMCLILIPSCGAASTMPVAELGFVPGKLYALSMAPACDYEARVRMWNPSTGEIWVDAARMDGIVIHSAAVPGYGCMVSVAVGRGMQVFYRTPVSSEPGQAGPARGGSGGPGGPGGLGAPGGSGGPDSGSWAPTAGPPLQALSLLAEPLSCDLALLSANYVFSSATGEPIAGRETVEVRVSPKWPGNVGRTVWADHDTGAALRIEDRDYCGDLIWLWEVEQISYAAPRPQMLEAARAALSSVEAVPCAAENMPLGEVSTRAGFQVALPSWVPEGYRLVAVRPARVFGGLGQRRPMAPAGPVVQLVYSDGLGAISLYERKVPWFARRASLPRPGRSIEWERGGARYVLVGDIDPELLLKMARSL